MKIASDDLRDIYDLANSTYGRLRDAMQRPGDITLLRDHMRVAGQALLDIMACAASAPTRKADRRAGGGCRPGVSDMDVLAPEAPPPILRLAYQLAGISRDLDRLVGRVDLLDTRIDVTRMQLSDFRARFSQEKTE